MDYQTWQHKRSELMDRERAERSKDLASSRPPIQAAVNEQAIRELYDKVEALEKAAGERQALKEKRG